jgi:hypothetical protein
VGQQVRTEYPICGPVAGDETKAILQSPAQIARNKIATQTQKEADSDRSLSA